MKNLLIQLIAFLFIGLTPTISWVAVPLYVMLNLLLAFSSITALLATSRQTDGQIEFERTSFAGRLFQIWYWTNVAIATPCIVYASTLLIFWTQQGNHIVTSRETCELNNLSGRMDVLYGRSKNDSNPRATKTLIALILFDPNRSYEKTSFSGGDGTDVSATNVQLDAKGENTFCYGSGWNRTSDLLAIQDKQFTRTKGNVFVILQTDTYPYDIIQLPAMCNATKSEDVIRFAKEQCEKIGEERLRSLRITK
ncbi:MAG: hypothetical protein ACK56W_13670 [Pirellula sp.]|jgi:hypothetical protein|nr:hypothetical protein [Pirellula sp.]